MKIEPFQSVSVLAGVGLAVLLVSGCAQSMPAGSAMLPGSPTGPGRDLRLAPSQNFPTILVPEGYRIEKVVEGLTYPTALTFDNQGRMYVAEAGGAFLDLPPAARILRVEGGRATEMVNLDDQGVQGSLVGLTWHNGAFYISHRDPRDRSGAVSRVAMDGTVTRILTGILDSQSEHQVNDIKVGPDGRMYLATGPATNAGVVGLDLAPFIMRSPDVKPVPCKDLVLTGINYRTPDFRTEDPSDVVETGAYVPFGTKTTPGQRITGSRKCGGSVLVFDPNNAEATVQPFASGLRNTIGLAFNSRGELYAGVNGYDIRGSRSVNDEFDATYRIQQGAWYGWPEHEAYLLVPRGLIFEKDTYIPLGAVVRRSGAEAFINVPKLVVGSMPWSEPPSRQSHREKMGPPATEVGMNLYGSHSPSAPGTRPGV